VIEVCDVHRDGSCQLEHDRRKVMVLGALRYEAVGAHIILAQTCEIKVRDDPKSAPAMKRTNRNSGRPLISETFAPSRNAL